MLCLLACTALTLASTTHAQAKPELLGNRTAFIDDLLGQMTVDEKIGQLRLVSIAPDMPAKKLADELAAGRVGGTFNSVTRADNRPLQDGAMRSRLKIPLFFAYDVIHGHRTTFPIGLGLASSWDLDVVATAMRTAAEEAAADGIDMTFAPMVDISRDAGDAPRRVLAKTPTWSRASPKSRCARCRASRHRLPATA